MNFKKAKLLSTTEEGRSSVVLSFEVDQSIKNDYQVPGQYVVLKHPVFGEGYFAMASAPSDEKLSFLIKENSPLTATLSEMKIGDELEISEPQGDGYAVDRLKGKNLHFFCVGSGIAPVRACLRELLQKRDDYKKLNLYYGCRRFEDFSFKSELESWQSDYDLRLLLTLSSPDSKWKSYTGYVQNLLPGEADLSKEVAVVCGMAAMQKDVKSKLTSLGVLEENILTNY